MNSDSLILLVMLLTFCETVKAVTLHCLSLPSQPLLLYVSVKPLECRLSLNVKINNQIFVHSSFAVPSNDKRLLLVFSHLEL